MTLLPGWISAAQRLGAELKFRVAGPSGLALNAVPAPLSHRAGHRARRRRFRSQAPRSQSSNAVYWTRNSICTRP